MVSTVGVTLKQIRVDLNLSCADVADKLGISRQRYAQIEKNVNAVKLSTLEKVLSVLGYNIKIFFDKNMAECHKTEQED